ATFDRSLAVRSVLRSTCLLSFFSAHSNDSAPSASFRIAGYSWRVGTVSFSSNLVRRVGNSPMVDYRLGNWEGVCPSQIQITTIKSIQISQLNRKFRCALIL